MLDDPEATLDSPHGSACSGIWAYLNFVRQQPQISHCTRDLEHVDGQWVFADRLLACGDGGAQAPAMPPSLAEWGCGN